MRGSVIYNQVTRRWQVWRNGQVLHSYPPGYDGECAAYEHQVALNDLPTLRLIQKATKRYPELRGRLIKAAAIYIDRTISLAGGLPYVVKSQNGNGLYEVDINVNGDWTCQCPDFEYGLSTNARGAPWQGGSPKCKHILAVMMLIHRHPGLSYHIFEEVR